MSRSCKGFILELDDTTDDDDDDVKGTPILFSTTRDLQDDVKIY